MPSAQACMWINESPVEENTAILRAQLGSRGDWRVGDPTNRRSWACPSALLLTTGPDLARSPGSVVLVPLDIADLHAPSFQRSPLPTVLDPLGPHGSTGVPGRPRSLVPGT